MTAGHRGACTILVATAFLALACLDARAAQTTGDDGAKSKQPEAPATWRAIRQVAETPAALTYEQFRTRVEAEAQSIARGADRSSIEALVRSIGVPLGFKDTSVRYWSLYLSGRVIAIIADPNGKHGLKSAGKGLTGGIGLGLARMNWYGLATAAIDTYRDAAARDLLLWIALEAHRDPSVQPHVRVEPPYIHALGYLRTYPPRHVRVKLEAALRAHAADAKPLRPKWRDPTQYLRAALASMDYSARLQGPAERSRYHGFERRLWRAWGLSKRYSRIVDWEYSEAATVLDKSWREGDERFVLRIFEEPAVAPEELEVAVYLAHRLPPAGQEKLREMAAGDGPKAAHAKKALHHVARKAKYDAYKAAREARRKALSQPSSPESPKP